MSKKKRQIELTDTRDPLPLPVEAPAIVQERMELEHARIEELPEEEPSWSTVDQELGIGAPLSDQDRRDAEFVASLPHETRISNQTKEALQELQELNTVAAKHMAGEWHKQEELTREPERVGRILHSYMFLNMLWKCGVVALYTRCDTRGLHSLRGEAHARERRALYERSMAGLLVNGSALVSIPRPQYVTWVQLPAMHEFSVMRFDQHGIATTEKYRGWRTVLIELIRGCLLSESKCNEVFGLPSGPGARRWQEIMFELRNKTAIAV